MRQLQNPRVLGGLLAGWSGSGLVEVSTATERSTRSPGNERVCGMVIRSNLV